MLNKLHSVYIDAKSEYEEEKSFALSSKKNIIYNQKELTIAIGDNYDFVLDYYASGNRIDLIYMDPPFYSMADYSSVVKTTKIREDEVENTIKISSYKDSWAKKNGMEEYLKGIIKILLLSKDVMTEKGVIWIHLDHHAVHYVKVLADNIFGTDCFLNEIIWNYKSGGAGGNQFSRKHDTLLVYSNLPNRKLKVPKEKSYNRNYKPYRFAGVKEYEDKNGWYTLVNMKDVWQIDMVGRTSKERNGYATQKPKELLKRIIESSSEEGNVCADFYGGSGAFAMACTDENMNLSTKRKIMSCDINPLSARLLEKFAVKNNISHEVIDKFTNKKVGYRNDPISIKINIEENLAKIVGYELDIDTLSMKKEEKEKLINIYNSNPLSFISYYQIYNTPKVIIDNENNNKSSIEECKYILPDKNNVLNLEFAYSRGEEKRIRILDVFGNETIVKL